MDNHAVRSPASAEDPNEAAHEIATLLQHPRQAKPICTSRTLISTLMRAKITKTISTTKSTM